MKPFSRLSSTLAVLLAFTAPAFADQPKMKEAVHHLEQAKAALEQAEHGKGGHREAALDLVEKALHQVREGIRAGER